MIEGLKPYPELKESGVPGVGAVPAHWEVLRAKYLFREVDERSANGEECHLAMSQQRGLVPRSSLARGSLVSASYAGGRLVRVGDIVLNRLKAHLGVFAQADQDGVVSPDYTVLRPSTDLQSRYFAELLRSDRYRGELRVRTRGIVEGFWRLYTEDFYDIPLCRPPFGEQALIVRFLDHADRRVRRLIAAKQRMIKLLEEQRREVVRSTVSGHDGGLATSIPQRPRWFGEPPSHWEVWRLGHLARLGNGSTPARGNPEFWAAGAGYPWLNSSSVNRARVDSADQFVTDAALRECHLPRVAPGSVLVAITGQGKTRGKATVLDIEATINQHLVFITPRNGVVTGNYLAMVLTAAYPELRRISDDSGSTKGALTCADLRHFEVPVPPPKEQEALLTRLRSELSDSEAAQARADREITLLREYRTRLVSDVVTGKLDVRAAAASLADDAEPGEPLDDAEPDDAEDVDEPADEPAE